MTTNCATCLTLSESDGVARITLHREPCNEIGTQMLSALETALAALQDAPPRALIVKSANERGFCAGADLRELYRELLATPDADAGAELERFIDRIHAVMTGFDELPCPTIAVVNGICFGGGFELALACDIRIAERNARFAFPELRLGLIPGFGGIPRLRREIGGGPVMDLLLTGRSVNARKALALGLVSQMVPVGEGVEAAVAMAEQMTRFDAHAATVAKRFAKRIPHAELAEERRIFLDLAQRPVVLDALARFATSEEVLPYVG